MPYGRGSRRGPPPRWCRWRRGAGGRTRRRRRAAETTAPALGSAWAADQGGRGTEYVDVGRIAKGERARERLTAAERPPDREIIIVGGEPRPLIPPGIYDATCVNVRRGRVGRAPKLILLFDVHVAADN